MKTKPLSTAILLLAMFLSVSCKKSDSGLRDVIIKVSNIQPETTYGLTIKKDGVNVIVVNDSNHNQEFKATVQKGKSIRLTYYFQSKGKPNGKADLDVLVGSKNLFHTNGGSAPDYEVVIP
jgi:hypothetical protein